jgi:amidohydrolase
MDTLQHSIQQLLPNMLSMRRDLHRHPELAFKEYRTSEILAKHLEGLGLEVTRGIAETGLMGRLKTGRPGRTVMVRADIDALPILEASGAEYTSQNPGVHHACGHDGHATIAAHVATLLTQMRDQLSGEVRFVFQPAEEIVAGARPMVEAGVMEGVDRVVGLHLWNEMPVGWVGVRAGPSMAAADAFTLHLKGRGGHAAVPHLAVDTVVMASQIVLALQTLVSRETNPVHSSVITIATVIAGEGAHNIIPETVELRGTLRTFDAELRSKLQQRIFEMSRGIAAAMGGEASITWRPGSPAVVNNEEMVGRFRQVAESMGAVSTIANPDPIMGGDDMAEFLNRAPGVYFFVGSNDASTGRNKPHHHPGFDFDDERALPVATELLTRTALDLLMK